MKRYDPQSPEATEPGDHPLQGERKGLWKVLVISFVLAVIGLFAAGLYFGAFESGNEAGSSGLAGAEADQQAGTGTATR